VAPEVLADKGYDGKTADTWSIGVILYVLLAGFLPFDEPTMVSLFKKIQSGDYNFPSWFSPGARDLIGSILVVDPTQRFTLEQISEHEWFNTGYEDEVRMSESMAKEPKIEVSESEVRDAVTEGVGIEKYGSVVKSDSGALRLNAFDVIHLVGGLALNNLFNFVNKAHLPWKRSYTFISAMPATETFERLLRLFQETSTVTLPHERPASQTFKLKDIRVEHKAQHVFISYKIYEINANVNVVEISRGKGDAIVFYKCMAKMTQAISECLGSGQIGEGVPASAESKTGGTSS
jgi:serine/threonine protein kinase